MAHTRTALAVLRKLTGLTQIELAVEAGFSQGSLSMWENGLISLPAGSATVLLRCLKPRLRRMIDKATPAQARVIRDIAAEDLQKPWDELLIERYEEAG